MKPYYEDAMVTLYHDDFRNVLPHLVGDAIVTDPPYGETSLTWDRWPTGWVQDAKVLASTMWCFGSLRMFLEQRDQFAGWKFSHEIVWEKHNGSGFATDKFRRVHELATLWYRGEWSERHHDVPRTPATPGVNKSIRKRGDTPHTGSIANAGYTDDGTRMQTSVIRVQSEQGRAVHPTQKPLGIVTPLIEFSVPVGGVVSDPFAGSGTTLLAAKLSGRRGVGAEVNEAYCEAAARRLSQQAFDLEGIA